MPSVRLSFLTVKVAVALLLLIIKLPARAPAVKSRASIPVTVYGILVPLARFVVVNVIVVILFGLL